MQPMRCVRCGRQDVDTRTGNLGLRADYCRPVHWGVFAPQLRRADSTTSRARDDDGYADLLGGPLYRAPLDGFDRNRVMFGLGAALYTGHELSLRLEYRSPFGGDENQWLLFNLGKKY